MRISQRTDRVLFAITVLALVGVLVAAATFRPGASQANSDRTANNTPGNPANASTTTISHIRPTTTVTVIGDSYTATPDSWTNLAIEQLSNSAMVVNAKVNAIGGTGYINGNGDSPPFGGRVDAAITPTTSVVVVLGSRNDMSYPPDQIEAAARDMYTEIRAKAPNAKIIIVGPPWVNENVPPEISAIRDRLAKVADEFGAVFVDPLADGWFFGADSRLIGADGVHPTKEGQTYMADKLRPVIAANLPQPAELG